MGTSGSGSSPSSNASHSSNSSSIQHHHHHHHHHHSNSTISVTTVEHQATVDKGLKMKIKRKSIGGKSSEAKHEIVQSISANKYGSTSAEGVSSSEHSGTSTNQTPLISGLHSSGEAKLSKHSSSKGRNHKDKKDKSRDKEKSSSSLSSKLISVTINVTNEVNGVAPIENRKSVDTTVPETAKLTTPVITTTLPESVQSSNTGHQNIQSVNSTISSSTKLNVSSLSQFSNLDLKYPFSVNTASKNDDAAKSQTPMKKPRLEHVRFMQYFYNLCCLSFFFKTLKKVFTNLVKNQINISPKFSLNQNTLF